MENNVIARTGRVQSWIDDPTSRLPVSCTVFVVEDSMEGPNGIEASWRFVSHALRFGAGVAVHLSNIRGRGTDNGKGLVASGPVSFGKIYSCLNEQLRRGGVYKNGAVVLHLDISHPDILEFVECPRSELPWAKRCVNLTAPMWLLQAVKSKKQSLLVLLVATSGLPRFALTKRVAVSTRTFAWRCSSVAVAPACLEHINLGCLHT